MPRINDPSRGAARRSLAKRIRLPRLSGRASAAWLVACFALSGLLIPAAYRLPVWIRFELVLAAWWLVWGLVLCRLLDTGPRITDDHHYDDARLVTQRDDSTGRRPRDDDGHWGSFFFDWFGGAVDLASSFLSEGCLGGGIEGLAIVVGLILLVLCHSLIVG